MEIELVMGMKPRPVPLSGGQLKVGGHAVLMGYSLEESTGLAVAKVLIYDGDSNTSGVWLPVPMSSGQGAENWFGPQGIHFVRGLLAVVTAGAVDGCLFMHLPD